jgi:hypothetical protein
MTIDTVYYIIAIILIVIGAALALFGRAIWDALLSTIGGMIGWIIGFGIGIYIMKHFFDNESWLALLVAIVLGFIGGFIMAALFGMLVEAALSLCAGLLIGIFVFYLTGNLLYAVIAMTVIAIITFIFIERLVAVITAFVGSVIAAAGIWFLKGFDLAVLCFVLLFVIGSAIQQFVLDDNTTGY